MVSCPLLPWMTFFAAADDSCHIHSSSLLPVFDQVQGAGYSESEVEADVAALQLETSAIAFELEMDGADLELKIDTVDLELETSAAALDLEMKIDVPQETSKHERYLTD
jgi:hypothetical protein